MSGAGKSTLVRCLNFLERPTSGTVEIEGKDLSALSEKELRMERRGIAMIFQHFNLLMQKNVMDNVCFPLRIAGVSKADARKRAKELLEIVGLSDKAKAYPIQLSGGQKQRVAIARALTFFVSALRIFTGVWNRSTILAITGSKDEFAENTILTQFFVCNSSTSSAFSDALLIM